MIFTIFPIHKKIQFSFWKDQFDLEYLTLTIFISFSFNLEHFDLEHFDLDHINRDHIKSWSFQSWFKILIFWAKWSQDYNNYLSNMISRLTRSFDQNNLQIKMILWAKWSFEQYNLLSKVILILNILILNI